MRSIGFVAVAIVLLILTVVIFPPIYPLGDLGLCLPSPNQWPLPRVAGWGLNNLVIFLVIIILIAATKHYNFLPETADVLPPALLILLACNCITTSTLVTSTLLLLANTLCLYVIITTYEARNSSMEFFIIGTIPAIGAMFQYSFLLMIPVYIGGGLLMKSFRIREFLAFILGLIAPYWILVGLGIISPFSFRFPDHLTIFDRQAVDDDIFYTLLAAGIMACSGVILMLYNLVKLFSRNSRMRATHLMFNLVGVVAILGMIFDFNNFISYFATIALWLSVTISAFLYLYELKFRNVVLVILLAVFLPIYILTL